MKNMLILLITLSIFGTVLIGCESKQSTSNENKQSISSENIGNSSTQQQVVDLNPSEEDAKWDSLIKDFYVEAENNPYCEEIYVFVKESSKLVDMTIVIPNGTSDEDGLECTTQLVKTFNDMATQIDDTFEKSSENYYGGIFDTYNLNLTVATPDTAMYESQWLVCQNIQAGTHDAIVKGGYTG